MSKQDTWAVDALLRKEEEANKLIKDAQLFREQRLKDAKDAAQHDIQQFRAAQEAKYQEEIKKYMASGDDHSTMEKQTKEEIVRINDDFTKNKDKVIDLIINQLFNVDISIPKTVKSTLKSQR